MMFKDIALGELVTALVTIGGFVITCIKLSRSFRDAKTVSDKNHTESVRRMDGLQHEMDLMRWREAVTNTELPISERMKAYDTYKAIGGDSWIDEYFEVVLHPAAQATISERSL